MTSRPTATGPHHLEPAPSAAAPRLVPPPLRAGQLYPDPLPKSPVHVPFLCKAPVPGARYHGCPTTPGAGTPPVGPVLPSPCPPSLLSGVAPPPLPLTYRGCGGAGAARSAHQRRRGRGAIFCVELSRERGGGEKRGRRRRTGGGGRVVQPGPAPARCPPGCFFLCVFVSVPPPSGWNIPGDSEQPGGLQSTLRPLEHPGVPPSLLELHKPLRAPWTPPLEHPRVPPSLLEFPKPLRAALTPPLRAP